MKIENIEKLQGWTPPGNPSVNPIVTQIETGIFDYTFWIRYQGRSYEMTLLRDYEQSGMCITLYRIAFRQSAAPYLWETWINKHTMDDMREFYDTFHTMLHRISSGTFEKHYITK